MSVKRLNVPAILFGGLAGIAAIVTVWFTVEAILLASGAQPITWYVRNLTSWEPGPTILVAVAIGFAVGAGVTHFVWDNVRESLRRKLS